MHDRFHGRREAKGRLCNWPDCEEPGEFRAPGVQPSGFDGPGSYRWFCLDHIRAFNAGYNYFAGMTADEIERLIDDGVLFAAEERQGVSP